VAKEKCQNGYVPYVDISMAKKMVDYFAEALIERGITVKQFNLSEPDIGKLAMALVDAATVVIGSPTVLVGLHPKVIYAACLANALKKIAIKNSKT